MSKAFYEWAAQTKAVQRAITNHDHAWLADHTDYKYCPACGERLRQKPKAVQKGGSE